ncbi:Permease of the drug/metabolite transporter (DMT) superfamily [Bhargavaea ginsengi]|uniref:Permease of the drug/metabolite transporter (DMT) superfamily n=1 Tax=Bhargavaea ginsengi TaxID=426757 RepID=A0A1H7AI00_9BACL|nr:DMT family transporter [Bhargavaea ginsengi]SEJ63517.1 Permease of the drug/metabolite transporter (DMT) superfamily [Bhargavaea ginsengi]
MWKIYVMLTLVMFMWGLNLPMLKYLLEFVGPVTMTSLRISTAGVAVFIILSAMKIIRLPRRSEWIYIIPGMLLNVVAHHYFLNAGLTMTSGTNAALILGTGPFLTAVFSSLLIRVFPSKLQWLGVLLGLIGVSSVVLAGGGMSGISQGDVFIFLSIATQVLSFLIVSKAAATLDPRLLTAYMLLIGGSTLFVISLFTEPGELAAFGQVPPTFWLIFGLSALFGTAISHLLYNYSVGQAGPTKAAIFMNLNTLVALLGSALFLGEVITIRHFLGLILIVTGVLFGSGAAEDLWKMRRTRKGAGERNVDGVV